MYIGWQFISTLDLGKALLVRKTLVSMLDYTEMFRENICCRQSLHGLQKGTHKTHETCRIKGKLVHMLRYLLDTANYDHKWWRIHQFFIAANLTYIYFP